MQPSIYDGPENSGAPLLIPAVIPNATTGTWNVSFNNGFYFTIRNVSDSAQGSAITFSAWLAAGTYTLGIFAFRGNDKGIYTITANGIALTSLGGSADTFDGYNAATGPTFDAITGLRLPDGRVDIKLAMLTKNALSTSYYGDISALLLTRTA